ncbi:hypothetical protein MIMGU_mgv11b024145mg [Erythranthe guttata]|uniref:Uncharacterized protein n=1 Tax=Erythranthe guttata TaxID=4155 RepID=A0A022RG81_ERYGU|nr:hypothetical protein MIMGU_mgv11b024145mg [Erythranthe guttata]
MALRQMLRRSLSSEKRSNEVPKGHLAVYVGQNEKRFVIPLSIFFFFLLNITTQKHEIHEDLEFRYYFSDFGAFFGQLRIYW